MRFRRTPKLVSADPQSQKAQRVQSRAARWSGTRAALVVCLLLILLGVAVSRAWIRADGIVAGELIAVSPIVQARLKEKLVNCLDHVTRGQRIAEMSNEATAEAAAQQVQQLSLQLQQSESDVEIATAEADSAEKLVEAQRAVLQQLVEVLAAYDKLVNKQYVATLLWENAKAAVARGKADLAAAEFVYKTKVEQIRKAESDADILRRRIQSYKNSPELVGEFFLTAPNDGIVTECTAHQGEVIPAKTPIFQIFNPNEAYAVLFFDPSDRSKLSKGLDVDLQVAGMSKPLKGHITGFYPELSALPTTLTRYFWQQERWSQYAPARVDFDGLEAAERVHLTAWAQISASRWRWSNTPCPGCKASAATSSPPVDGAVAATSSQRAEASRHGLGNSPSNHVGAHD